MHASVNVTNIKTNNKEIEKLFTSCIKVCLGNLHQAVKPAFSHSSFQNYHNNLHSPWAQTLLPIFITPYCHVSVNTILHSIPYLFDCNPWLIMFFFQFVRLTIKCGLHFFFTLSKDLDGVQLFLGYVSSTKPSFRILFSSLSRVHSSKERLWWTEGSWLPIN